MKHAVPPDPDRQKAIEDLDRLARWLDTQWRIPGTGIRFGFDPVISLVPGLGDLAGGLLAAHIVMQARKHGAPRSLVLQMLMNVGIDVVFGSVPVAGTIFDVIFKPSKRNMALLRRHLEKTGELPVERTRSVPRLPASTERPAP